MTKLEKLLAELCPDGVEYKELHEILIITNGSDYKGFGEGNIPVYGSGGIMTYVDTFAFDKPSVLIPRKGSIEKLYYVDTPFWNVDTIFYTDIDTSKAIPRYVYHCLLKEHLEQYNTAGGVPSLTQKVLNKVIIPVPPLEVQAEIVRILDNYSTSVTALQQGLEKELAARKKQYEYYRDTLLSFGSDCEWRTLSALFPLIRNGFVGTVTPYYTDSENGVRYLQGTNIHNGVISDNEVIYVNKAFHKKHIKNELKQDDILVVQSGTPSHVGECAVVGEKYAGSNCHALIVMSNGGLCDSKFITYYLHTSHGKMQLKKMTTGGTVRHILASTIGKIRVPVPPMKEQERIVSILDRFDKLCNDISEGLPAEIEARRKQYEYYRDKLLSFKEVKL